MVDLDRNRCLDSLRRLGMAEPEQMVGLYAQSGPFMALENGSMTAGEFHAAMRPYFPPSVTVEQIDEAFSSFIVGIPLLRLKALRELKRRFRLYILSNTNPIMFNGVIARDFAQEGLTVDDYFDGVILSYEARSCKPDRRIFDYAVERFDLDPSETLFLDDGQENIVAARRLGFNAILVEPGHEFMPLLERYFSKNN